MNVDSDCSSIDLSAFRTKWPNQVEFGSLMTRGLCGVCHLFEPNLDFVLSLMHSQFKPLDSANEVIDSRLHLDDKYYLGGETTQRFFEAMQECRIFVAENGSIGVAPEGAQSGDSICIVKGACAPYIVRPIGDNQWLLISGDCFLWRHPIPRVQDWEKGDIEKEDLWNSCLREGVEEDIFLC